MLTLQTDVKLICPVCGNVINFDTTVIIENQNTLDCPHCGDQLFLHITMILLTPAFVRSNSKALADFADAENELLADIDAEIEAEIKDGTGQQAQKP